MTATASDSTTTTATEELPPGWTVAAIGEVCLVNPRRPSLGELPGGLPVTFVPMPAVDAQLGAITQPEIRPLASVRKGFTAFQNGDVIMAKITPCMENGKAALASGLENGLGFGSTEFHVLRSGGTVLAEYVYHFIRQESFRREAEERMTGSVGQKRVPAAFISDHSIPVPPLPEQQRIVAALEATLGRLEAARARLARIPEILKRYRASLLKAACEGRLVPTEAELARAEGRDYEPADVLLARILKDRRAKWEESELAKFAKASRVPPANWQAKYKQPAPPDTSGLPELPEGWRWTTPDELLLEPLANGRSVVDATPGFPVLRLSALRNGGVDLSERKTGQWTKADAEPFLVREGDFLVARGNGSIGLVGRGGLVGDVLDEVAYPDTLIRVRLNHAGYLASYLKAVWNADLIRSQIEVAARTSAGIFKISQQDIRGFALPLPPVAEQRRIVAAVERQLAVIERLEAVVAANLQRCERMREAVLAKAFRGELASSDLTDGAVTPRDHGS